MKKIIKFSATWCMPCKVFATTFHKVTERFKDSFEFLELDVEDENSLDLVEKFQIKSLPTVIVTDENNDEIGRIVGNISEQSFAQIIEDNYLNGK